MSGRVRLDLLRRLFESSAVLLAVGSRNRVEGLREMLWPRRLDVGALIDLCRQAMKWSTVTPDLHEY